MKTKSNMRRVVTTLFVACAALPACADQETASAGAAPGAVELQGTAKGETEALLAHIGVEPGSVTRTEGAAAVLAVVAGSVEVRRLGEESFVAAPASTPLYLGDQVRAGESARATISFPDESTAELAEVSTLAIGSRVTSADPASSAALLSGVARFSVEPRAPGEGPFMVFTPAGVIATKGTVFGVGVAADGDARVGVESGQVEVSGAAALDAPVSLDANAALELGAKGQLQAPAPWPADDWGTWRDAAEAELDVAATASAHAAAMTELSAQLDASYGAIESLGGELVTFEAKAAADASANDVAAYEASLPDASAAIEASFLAGLRLEWLTHAYVSHAVLAADLYVRHPQVVAWTAIEPRVHAAVLWPKRFDATAVLYLEPLRVQYYLHHPRGRMQAHWTGVNVPAFYAAVTPPPVPSAHVQAKLKFKVFTPPAVLVKASARPVWIAAPSASWHAKAKLKAAAPRGKVAFWVRPSRLQCKALLGAQVKGKVALVFGVRAPAPRAELKAHGGLALGHRIKVEAPDLDAAARARASWNGELPAPDAHAELDGRMPDLKGHGKLDAKAKGHGKFDARAEAAHAEKAHAKAKLQGGAASAGVSGSLKLKGPELKAPKVKAQGKAQGKAGAQLKLGH